MSPRRSGWLLRGGLVLFTFAMALLAFQAGVGTSDREGLPTADLLTHVYYSLGLFVLGGLDLGIPRGGPVEARAVLWLAYFVAPMITTSAVVEGAVRLLQPEWLRRRGLRDHVVIVGIGRLGVLVLEALRERDPRAQVLVVDRDGDRANVQHATSRLDARFSLGDVRTAAALDSMALDRARAVLLLTDDDLVNLEAAWSIAERAPRARIVAHVADLGMRRTVARVEGATAERVQVFNAHRIAAERLYEEHLERHFEDTAARDVVVLAGFGRFGQTILEHLQREACGAAAARHRGGHGRGASGAAAARAGAGVRALRSGDRAGGPRRSAHLGLGRGGHARARRDARLRDRHRRRPAQPPHGHRAAEPPPGGAHLRALRVRVGVHDAAHGAPRGRGARRGGHAAPGAAGGAARVDRERRVTRALGAIGRSATRGSRAPRTRRAR
ncbi:MAG: NAD-binding protein [Sandaracinaceae bacterium]|nr:NAD-binding protein [Sandaracinaceae bacterium]